MVFKNRPGHLLFGDQAGANVRREARYRIVRIPPKVEVPPACIRCGVRDKCLKPIECGGAGGDAFHDGGKVGRITVAAREGLREKEFYQRGATGSWLARRSSCPRSKRLAF